MKPRPWATITASGRARAEGEEVNLHRKVTISRAYSKNGKAHRLNGRGHLGSLCGCLRPSRVQERHGKAQMNDCVSIAASYRDRAEGEGGIVVTWLNSAATGGRHKRMTSFEEWRKRPPAPK